MGDDTQLNLASWHERKISKSAYRKVRHAYEEALTACARLSSFSSGWRSDCDPVSERQEVLAYEDLSHFAFHARRLIETTGSRGRFRHVWVKDLGMPDEDSELRLMDLINAIIHHKEIEIIGTKRRLKWLGDRSDILGDLANPYLNGRISPLLYVCSDRREFVLVRISDVVAIFEEKVLGPIIELCAEQGLFLEDFFRD